MSVIKKIVCGGIVEKAESTLSVLYLTWTCIVSEKFLIELCSTFYPFTVNRSIVSVIHPILLFSLFITVHVSLCRTFSHLLCNLIFKTHCGICNDKISCYYICGWYTCYVYFCDNEIEQCTFNVTHLFTCICTWYCLALTCTSSCSSLLE